MDDHRTEEQRMILKLAEEIAERELAPSASAIDEQEAFPWQGIRTLAAQGLLGLNLPRQFGGGGLPFLVFVAVIEELAKACASTALVFATQTHAAHPILSGGSVGLRERYVPDLAGGSRLGAIAITEPSAGSDAAAMRSTAVRDGGAYRLNGNKVFITTGQNAGIVVVFATVDRERGRGGISAFVLEKGWPGFAVGKVEKKMGMRGSDTAELIFANCPVPAENLIGGEGQGFALLTDMLNKSRPNIAAIAVGIAQAACDVAMRYAQQRIQFGRPIAALGPIQGLIADMVTQISAARLLTQQAARSLDSNAAEVPLHSSMAKLFASDVAMEVTTNAVQVLGGYGYTRDFAAERLMRDAKVTQIFEGTNQIQRGLIANRVMRDWRNK